MAVKTKFYNLDTDTTLGGNSASDLYIASQKAVKTYVDNKTPTVNDATLTITQNNTAKGTFTANASTDVSINITVPTKTSDLTNDDGFITGITSSDVTTALGYTPYNSTNPSGYQANVIETIKVNGTALTPSSKAVDVTVPTETTVSGWGFTKNTGTVTSVNNTQPDANGNVTISTGVNYTAGTGIDITNDVISVASPTLTNTATGSNSLSILGTASSGTYAVNIGGSSVASTRCVAIGYDSNAGSNGTALGYGAWSNANYAIQLGYGKNSEANSFYVGTSNTSGHNYKLLGDDGLIPDARISSNIARTSSIPTVDQTYDGTSTNAQSGTAVAGALTDYVPTSRTINGKALSSNITLSASDVSALPSSTVIPTVTFRAWS